MLSQFGWKNKSGAWSVGWRGIQTCSGKSSVWNFLKREGYVIPMPYGKAMGHTFAFNVTEKGEAFLRDICDQLNQVHADDSTESERHTFSK